MIRPNIQGTLDDLWRQYPWPQRFFDDDLFFRYVAGEVPAQALFDALEEALGDLPLFVGWAYDQHDPERKVTGWLREGSWLQTIVDLRTQAAHLVELAQSIGKTEKDVNTLLRKTKSRLVEVRTRILWSTFKDVRAKLSRQGVDKEVWQARVVDSPIGTIPSLDAMLEPAIDYFLRNVMAGAHQRELLVSDYGDILHMAYIPYVDIFRCDGYAADIARKAASKFGTEVVGKLTLLPEAITRITQRATV